MNYETLLPNASPTLLAGVRVLDASRVLAGPFCGQLLADLGADVVKVERPGHGDETRAWGPPFAGPLSAYYLSCNRGKRSVTLDLARPEGQAVFQRLAARSDVLLENFRPASARKLGVAADQLLAVHPRLVVCSITGFGHTGPLHDLPGYDFALQALSGLMSITGPPDGPPFKVGVALVDILTGLNAAVAVLACLHARRESGHGYHVDLAMLDVALASQVNVAQAFLTSGRISSRQGNAHLQIVPYQLFATADSWLVLAVGNDGQWQHFCEAAGRPDLAADSRFTTNRQRVEARSTLVPLLEPILRARSTADWERSLHEAGVPCAPVWTYDDLFAHPQIAARHMKVTIRDRDGNRVDLLGSPLHVAGAARPEPTMPPQLGEHTDEVLREIGLSDGEVANLRKLNVV